MPRAPPKAFASSWPAARLATRKVLLATGVVDHLPQIGGVLDFYGRSVHYCPYCDGWEWRDQTVVVYGRESLGLALKLTCWTRDLVLCTDGPAALDADARWRLAARGIPVREGRIARLEGKDGRLERVVFADGSALPRRALFFK